MRHAVFLAIVTVLGAAFIGCASKAHRATSYERIDARKDDIRDLWIQIRGWRVEAGMAPDPSIAMVRMGSSRLRICPANPRTEVCQDVCTLKDAICANAARICEIADELGGDPWADDKCTSARASCKEARDRCCRCAEREPPPDDEEESPPAGDAAPPADAE